MNFENDSFSSGGKVLDTQTPPPHPQGMPKQVPLRPEEVAMFKSCSRELYFKVGIPFAVICEILLSRFSKAPVIEQSASKALIYKGFRIFGNIFLGSLLGTPMCYSKLVAMRAEYLRNHPELENQSIVATERVQTLPQSKDLGYPAQVPNPDDLESSFSSDFSTSRLIIDEPENVKTSKTTYQELRAKHRSGNDAYRRPPPNLEPAPTKLGSYPTLEEKPLFDEPPPPSSPPPPQRIVKKTKYGDEME